MAHDASSPCGLFERRFAAACSLALPTAAMLRVCGMLRVWGFAPTDAEHWSTNRQAPKGLTVHVAEGDAWAGLDLNQRRQMPTGLQPVPFGHSGTDPGDGTG